MIPLCKVSHVGTLAFSVLICSFLAPCWIFCLSPIVFKLLMENSLMHTSKEGQIGGEGWGGEAMARVDRKCDAFVCSTVIPDQYLCRKFFSARKI